MQIFKYFFPKLFFFLSKLVLRSKKFQINRQDSWPGINQEGQRILRGNFTFWGETLEKKQGLFWQHPEVSKKFQNELHGFEWLRSLKTTNHPEARGIARAYILDWLRTQKRWHETSWGAEITGKRISSWIELYNFYGASADDDFQIYLQKNLTQQVFYLRRLCMLISDEEISSTVLKALLYADLACEKAPHALLTRLESFLYCQFFSEGTHKSRSPIIQLKILKDLLDIRAALNEARYSLPSFLQPAIARIATAVRTLRLGDGGLAIFHNSIEGAPLLIDMVLSQTEIPSKPLEALPETGYFRLSSGKAILIFDAGTPLSYQPLNQDRLALEFSYENMRLLVNGIHPFYGDNASQQPDLSNQISGTLIFFDNKKALIGEESSPSPLHWETWRQDQNGHLFSVSEWAQENKGILLGHQRCLYLASAGTDLRGEEKITGPEGGTALLRFNFHPTIETIQQKDKNSLYLLLPNQKKWRFTINREAELSLHRTYYYGGNNKEQLCQQLLIKSFLPDGKRTIKWNLRLLEE